MATWANLSSRGLLSRAATVRRKHWHIKATAGACVDIISSYSVVYQRVHLWEPLCKSDLFTCLFEMIGLMFTGVWNHLWYINEMIKSTGLPPLRELSRRPWTQQRIHCETKLQREPWAHQLAASHSFFSVGLHEDAMISVREHCSLQSRLS